ncbi:MAG: hypothetical protein WDM76_13890 [Limisphaerales bacterium]
MRTHLAECLAEYYTRKGLWNNAIELWEFVQQDNIFCQNAVGGIVEIQVAAALLAIKRGLELVKKFNQGFDPETETTLPGNDKKIQQQAEKQFRKWRKILEKIVPEKRQKNWGLNWRTKLYLLYLDCLQLHLFSRQAGMWREQNPRIYLMPR